MSSLEAVAAPPRVSAESIAYLGLIGATVGWASAFITGKVVLLEVPPLVAAAGRHAIAALVLLPFALRLRPTAQAVRGVAAPLCWISLAGGVLYPYLFLEALARTSAANCSLLIALNPLFTVMLSPLIGEPRERRWGGILLALGGAALVITRGDPENVGRLARLSFASGDLLAVIAAMLWASFNLASKRVVAVLPPAFINCLIFAFGALCLFALGAGDQPFERLGGMSAAAAASLTSMAVLSSVLAGNLFLLGMRAVGVNRTVVFIYLVPVVTAVLSMVFLGEQVGAAQAIGGAAVLVGVYWTTRPRQALASR
jgi:drug/metabolite transporter (DMT)-like permease